MEVLHERPPPASPSDPPGPSAGTRPRDATFDILKGLSIVEVMTHHTLSTGMRKFTVDYDPLWWTMAVLSRILHFAVPTFLLVSAVLLARSVASRPVPDWRRFYARRVQRSLWPYLIWTAIYITFRVLWLRAESDMAPAQLNLGFAAMTAPSVLMPDRLWLCLLWGKGYFHLYFMVILLQFSVLFPLLLALMRGLRLRFGAVLLISGLIQWAVFMAQRHWLGLRWPGSTVVWYCMPVITGMWLGMNWALWEDIWRRWRLAFGALAVAGLAVYLPPAVMHYLHRPYSSLVFNGGIAVYCMGVALLLLGFSKRLVRTNLPRRFFQAIGDRSIAFFLIHPAILFLMGGPKVTAFLDRLPAPTLVMGLLLLAVTWALSEASRRLRLDGILFGR